MCVDLCEFAGNARVRGRSACMKEWGRVKVPRAALERCGLLLLGWFSGLPSVAGVPIRVLAGASGEVGRLGCRGMYSRWWCA